MIGSRAAAAAARDGVAGSAGVDGHIVHSYFQGEAR